MKTAILLLLTLTSAGFTSAVFHPKRRFKRSLSTYDFEEEYFSQKLDHFDVIGDEKWWQRYYALKNYYQEGGPAFLFVNGEWPVEPGSVADLSGHWLSYAEELNAYCFALEHRFYGKSWPKNGDMMRYLSMEQAGADIAYFIQRITEQYELPEDIKWIIFGCSYAGEVVTWARLKYPHLIHGAVASSSTMWYKALNPEYLQTVENSLKSYSPKCVESISLANREMHSFYSKEVKVVADQEVGTTESPESSTSSTFDSWTNQEMDNLYSSTSGLENTSPTSDDGLWTWTTSQERDSPYTSNTVARKNTAWTSELRNNRAKRSLYSTAATTENTVQASESSSLWTTQEMENPYTATSGPENIEQTYDLPTNQEMNSLYTTSTSPGNTPLTFESWVNENHYADSLRDLYENMDAVVMGAVQHHETSPINITTLCDIMTNYNDTRTRYQSLIKLKELYDGSQEEDIIYDESYINEFFYGDTNDYDNADNDNNDDDDAIDGYYQDSRSYDYQICSEFGQLPIPGKTSNLSLDYLFDSVENLVQETCGQFYGPNFTIDDLNEKISYTNMVFGGLNFNVANTLFVHGSLDPWHELGFYQTKNDSLYQTVYINGTSHCADMNHADDDDIQELKEARKEILGILKDWLQKK